MKFEITGIQRLTASVFEMTLRGDCSAFSMPGQFVEISIPGLYLRRPISVCDIEGNRLTLVIKTVGKGTEALLSMSPGMELDLLTGLGHGFETSKTRTCALLAGGGVGVPPLYLLARRLLAEGKKVKVALGFNTASEIFYAEKFRALGADVCIATIDGSEGVKGFVTDAIDSPEMEGWDFWYACGPLPMLQALGKALDCKAGEVSMEERMGCGFGACMGCTIETPWGPKRVCKEGPVFPADLMKNFKGNGAPSPTLARDRHQDGEPAVSTELCGITLRNPIVPASGTFGFGKEFADKYDLNLLGGISIKGTTLHPRFGNLTPRIAETPDGMINSVGLQNPGAEEVYSREVPELRKIYSGCVIANVSGFSVEEYVEACKMADQCDGVDIIEVNVSCPNVHNGGMAFGTSAEQAAEVTRAVKAAVKKPVFIKLSPNVTDIVQIAKACEEAGADGLTLINTLLGMRIDIQTGAPVIANTMGGFSGPAVFPVAVRMVYQVARAVKIPVMGCGGVSTAEELVEMMMAGASAVQVGSANLVEPMICATIAAKLPQVLKKLKINNIRDIIGISWRKM
ncbi:MAG: dihydroorotate dehydrogenase [Muribaculaceae bacterium]|nr:dihydroorotate dehydrogenase [Muribaculaceae bacterium]